MVGKFFDAADRILFPMKPAMDAMHFAGDTSKVPMLENSDWKSVKEIKDCLKPFRDAQLELEGEKHATPSMHSVAIFIIGSRLKNTAEAGQNGAGARELAQSLLADFNVCWKEENQHVFEVSGKPLCGRGNRQIGIHPTLCVATFLDPRQKKLTFVSQEEKVVAAASGVKKIW